MEKEKEARRRRRKRECIERLGNQERQMVREREMERTKSQRGDFFRGNK